MLTGQTMRQNCRIRGTAMRRMRTSGLMRLTILTCRFMPGSCWTFLGARGGPGLRHLRCILSPAVLAHQCTAGLGPARAMPLGRGGVAASGGWGGLRGPVLGCLVR